MKFIEDDNRSINDLPWVNEYLSGIGEEGDVSPVEEIIPSPKGLIVICKDFKGFLFKNTKIYDRILEATEHWRINPNPGYTLFAQALSSGKIAIAIEESLDGIFSVDKKGKVSVKCGKDTTELDQNNSNPFIRTNIPAPTTSTKRKGTNGGTSAH